MRAIRGARTISIFARGSGMRSPGKLWMSEYCDGGGAHAYARGSVCGTEVRVLESGSRDVVDVGAGGPPARAHVPKTRGLRHFVTRLLFVFLASVILCVATVGPDTAVSPWQRILSSINLPAGSVTVIAAGSAEPAKQVVSRVEHGAFIVLEGDSEAAEAFGFSPQSKHVAVRSEVDARAPKLSIVWEKALELAVFSVPKDARVFAWERWEHAPLMAGFHRGAGAVLWVAASPGVQGYERFPYLPQALYDLGARPA